MGVKPLHALFEFEEVEEQILTAKQIFGVATHDLDRAKELIEDGMIHVTRTARIDAISMGYVSDEDIGGRVLKLKKSEIYKTMESEDIPGLWQDVYRTDEAGIMIYIKIQINNGIQTVVISFKKK